MADMDEFDRSNPAAVAKRSAAFEKLAQKHSIAVRLGEITRMDDGLIGFFIGNNFSHLHVVDKVVRDSALEGGRRRGHLGPYGSAQAMPASDPITHDYIRAGDELRLRPFIIGGGSEPAAIADGDLVSLTLLMHPAGKVHLTSGVLPRKSASLARDWIDPGLSVMAPSAFVGPVLIEPDKVRLPKISVFPKDQTWTRRDSPYSWQDDPILAATQTALLPDFPAEIQEGYIRIVPHDSPGEDEDNIIS